jgi:hypothetical protein
MSIYVTNCVGYLCGVLRTTRVVHLKRASGILIIFRMSAAVQDLRRASHKDRLFKV